MSDLDRYDYALPAGLIAQHPIAERSDARLMVVRRSRKTISHKHIRDLPEILKAPDALVLNDTRVIPARLWGYRTLTQGRWEGLFLRLDERGNWLLMGKTRGKIQPGETVTLQDRRARPGLELRLLEKLSGGIWLARPVEEQAGLEEKDALELLDRYGRVPLPGYIRKGKMLTSDRTRYQTVYARHPGSAAAPTAGLHFTKKLLGELIEQGITPCRVTLHVGLDTFRPISSATLAEHKMHSEWGKIDAGVAERLNRTRAAGGRVVAVGTTTARLLETAAASGELQAWSGHTDLFIRPPYRFRAVDALLTNFHLPRSSLLVLVSTFGGHELIRRAYREAIRGEYRFYSYGDAMLIL